MRREPAGCGTVREPLAAWHRAPKCGGSLEASSHASEATLSRLPQVPSAKEMDETVSEFFRRTTLKIPMTKMMTILKTWNFLSENQLQTVNFCQKKESLLQDLVLLCEENRASLNDAALLDIIYTQFHWHQKVWDVFEMSKGPGEDIDLFDMEQFKILKKNS